MAFPPVRTTTTSIHFSPSVSAAPFALSFRYSVPVAHSVMRYTHPGSPSVPSAPSLTTGTLTVRWTPSAGVQRKSIRSAAVLVFAPVCVDAVMQFPP